MSISISDLRSTGITGTIVATFIALSSTLALAGSSQVTLSGENEVPAVTTTATAKGTISIGVNKSVSGSIKTAGMDGTMAHIHLAAPGKNGPPIITLIKSNDGIWTVPPGAMLTDAQFASYNAGDLYVNVHSAAPPSGEIRVQLKP
jgi:hypothetical protein